ncbi:Hypothetical protein DPCES_0187 [Desulfitobacterium hafniense]|uniref:Uncharacterized protein n=1 Tax=Desulfitobacterium hafniense TaxID=49338 RepID=A0A098AUI6_DESHA|nr:Hypothetical protein DPCES_0187 [Desulfitobacterium hafniense]
MKEVSIFFVLDSVILKKVILKNSKDSLKEIEIIQEFFYS